MRTVEEALHLILDLALPRPPVATRLGQAAGRVLAADVTSDIDSPPHDKAMVDGYAVLAADLASGAAELTVLEEVTAGEVPTVPLRPGTTTRVMTGAPVPEGTGAVVMVEKSEPLGDGRVVVREQLSRPGLNVMPRGHAWRSGATVVAAGTALRPVEIGLLAEVGCEWPVCHPAVSVAILATGNELVGVETQPAAGQIRNSNGPLLRAAAERLHAITDDIGVARDERPDLEHRIGKGLIDDVLVLSGGVSAGVLDLAPGVLRELGVREVFHHVNLKPGKPLWFGVLEGEPRRLVFGLPGNPVSSLVCFELFVKPAIRALQGLRDVRPRTVSARLAADFQQRSDRVTYFPAVLTQKHGERSVKPVDWKGSADLLGFSRGNALAIFASGARTYAKTEWVEVLPLG